MINNVDQQYRGTFGTRDDTTPTRETVLVFGTMPIFGRITKNLKLPDNMADV